MGLVVVDADGRAMLRDGGLLLFALGPLRGDNFVLFGADDSAA